MGEYVYPRSGCSISRRYPAWDDRNLGAAGCSFAETSSPFPPNERDQPRHQRVFRFAPVHGGAHSGQRRLLAPMLIVYVLALGEEPGLVVESGWSGHMWSGDISGISNVGISGGQKRYSRVLCLIVAALSSSRCRKDSRLIYIVGQCLNYLRYYNYNRAVSIRDARHRGNINDDSYLNMGRI